MGLFSWDCLGCGHPMLCKNATNSINAWMNNVVVLWPKGFVIGSYDGYGSVGGFEIPWEDQEPACWHEACWVAAGKPDDYNQSGPSDSSFDQGWFFNNGDHDMDPPNGT
jgi:hypothetical protein